MNLRERIEAKAVRTATLPLQVGDVAAAAAEVATLREALGVHLRLVKQRVDAEGEETEADRARADQLRDQLQAAKEREAETVVAVEIRALSPDLWDEILNVAPDDEEGVDLSVLRPALLAASCTDEDLRDEEWWAAQLAGPQWSKGDLLAINQLLLTLNLNTPDGRSGNV
jgi:hypothetical protein